MEEAAYYYRILGREYPKVMIRDGKTGEDLLNELATDKRFLPHLDEPGQAWMGKHRLIKAEQENISPRPMVQQYYTFEAGGTVLPFFQNHRLALNQNGHQFKLIDRATNEERWSQSLTPTNFQQFVQMGAGNPGGGPRYPYHAVGHLVVLPLGHMVFGIDPVGHRLLWEKSLTGQPGVLPTPANVIPDPRDGGLQIVYADGWVQRLGQTGPIRSSYVCLQTHDGLEAIDPLSGRTLWTRTDVSLRSSIFGDEEHIYVVEMGNDLVTPAATRAFRAYDGVAVRVPDFTALYQRRLRTIGRKLLLSDTDARGVTLRLYDVHTGKDVWTSTFAANSVVLQTEDPDLAGVVEPDGKVTAVNLPTLKVVLQTRVDPQHVAKAQSVYLLRDATQFYLFPNLPVDQQTNPWGGPWPNLVIGSGLRSLPVNGMVYAFAADTGKIEWQNQVSHQALILEQFHDLPILLFTARYQRLAGVGGGRMQIQGASVESIHKFNGKLLFNQPEMQNGPQFYALNVDLRGGRIELLGYNMKLNHVLVGSEVFKGKDAAAPAVTPGARTGTAAPGAVEVPLGAPAGRADLVPPQRILTK